MKISRTCSWNVKRTQILISLMSESPAHQFAPQSLQSLVRYISFRLQSYPAELPVGQNIYPVRVLSMPKVLAIIAELNGANGSIPQCWPFVRGIHRLPENSMHKGQLRGALMFSSVCAWIMGWLDNREAGDLRRHRTHYDVTVMTNIFEFLDMCAFCWIFYIQPSLLSCLR